MLHRNVVFHGEYDRPSKPEMCKTVTFKRLVDIFICLKSKRTPRPVTYVFNILSTGAGLGGGLEGRPRRRHKKLKKRLNALLYKQ